MTIHAQPGPGRIPVLIIEYTVTTTYWKYTSTVGQQQNRPASPLENTLNDAPPETPRARRDPFQHSPSTTNLEGTTNQPYNIYKSFGERRIAQHLQDQGIQFQYEKPTEVIDDKNRLRTWRPDFYLPEHDVFIEYYGMTGSNDYNRGIYKKTQVYANNGITVIPLYPTQLKDGSWKQYLQKSLRAIHEYRHHQSNRQTA